MDRALTISPKKKSLLDLCDPSPVVKLNVKILSSLGGRILPIVGDHNSGADSLIDEVIADCGHKYLYLLEINVPNTGFDCPSILDIISKKIGWNLEFGKFHALSVAESIMAYGFSVITIVGAANLTKNGIKEMTVLLDSLHSLSSSERQPPVILWHARPNWEATYEPEPPPCRYFFPNFYVPTADPKASVATIESALPNVGPIIIAAGVKAWKNVIEKTHGGELGRLLELDKMAKSIHYSSKLIGREKQTIDWLLWITMGESQKLEALASRPPLRMTRSKDSDNYAPPCQKRSNRGRLGNRNKRKRKSLA